MAHRSLIVVLVLAAAILACGPIGGSVIRPGASPTPPPIPTRPIATSTLPPTIGPAIEPTIPGDLLMNVIYGSARGMHLGFYYLSASSKSIVPFPLSHPLIKNAIWPAPSPDGTKLAFVSMQSDLLITGIFVVNSDGTNLAQLSQGEGMFPQWSPDGSKIAYTCNVNSLSDFSKAGVCVMNADGTGLVNLTKGAKGYSSYPHWTPDGHIVFMSSRDVAATGMFSEIYIMDGDGQHVTQLTNDKKYYDANPAVSPDGKKIVFESNKEVGSGSEIYTMNLDGSERIRLTNDDVWNQNPVWSPDGKFIMYAADDGQGNIDLYQMNADGTNPFRMTHIADEDGGLRLGHAYLPKTFVAEKVFREDKPDVIVKVPTGSSPVSNSILFATNNFNCPDCLETGIWFVTFDGAIHNKMPGIVGFFPAWSPDFQRFAYVVDGEIYLSNADTTNASQLTHGARAFGSLQWSKDGTQILATCQPYGQYDVCLVDTNTGAIRNITENLSYGSGLSYPTWISQDRILLGQTLMDTNGVQLGSIGPVFKPRYSPDGQQLAGISKRQIVVASPTGSDIVTLTTDAPTKAYPVWSPDGKLLIYEQAPGDGRVYLYAIRADGVNGPYKLVTQPIAAGPVPRPDVLNVFFGYAWAP